MVPTNDKTATTTYFFLGEKDCCAPPVNKDGSLPVVDLPGTVNPTMEVEKKNPPPEEEHVTADANKEETHSSSYTPNVVRDLDTDEELGDDPEVLCSQGTETGEGLRNSSKSPKTVYLTRIHNGVLKQSIELSKPQRFIIPPESVMTFDNGLMTTTFACAISEDRNTQLANSATYNVTSEVSSLAKFNEKVDKKKKAKDERTRKKNVSQKSTSTSRPKKPPDLPKRPLEIKASVTQPMMRKYLKSRKKQVLDRNRAEGEKNEEEKSSRKVWSRLFETHCNDVFNRCSNPTMTAQINRLYVGLIAYWTKKHNFDGKEVDQQLQDILKTTKGMVKRRYPKITENRRNMLLRDGLRKGLRRAYRKKLATFTAREDWMPNKSSEFAYIWRDEVIAFEYAGVGASWMLQECILPYDEKTLPSRHAASSVDKGGTIFAMIYDARDHRFFRVGLGLAEYIDNLKKEHRRLQGEIAKNPQEQEENRKRRFRMKEITTTVRRLVDTAHDIVIKLLTSTVTLKDGKKERRFSKIANPTLNVKGVC